jgi:hypothetical protein
MRLPVCSTRYWRSQLMTAVNSMNIASATPMDDQRAVALVHDHLVDDDLGEQRRRQADELDARLASSTSRQMRLCFEEFGEEPAEAEGQDVVLPHLAWTLHDTPPGRA